MRIHTFFYTLALLLPLATISACASASSSSSDVLIEYRRTGGFAGFDDHLVIYKDGSAVLTRQDQQSEFSIDTDTMLRLQDLFSQADFSDLRSEYTPDRQVADVFEYVISYQGKRVRAMDTAVPPKLMPVIQALNQIIDTGRGNIS
jgi:hypothetical protein